MLTYFVRKKKGHCSIAQRQFNSKTNRFTVVHAVYFLAYSNTGAVFAAVAGAESFMNTVGSIAAAQMYASTVAVYRGVVFFVFTAANLICLVMLG